MQPKIIENFITKETCDYLNSYFLDNIKLDDQGYSNINMSKFLPIYNDNLLLLKLDKKDPDQARFYDMLNLIMQAMKLQFNFSSEELGIELFNYRSFGSGQNFKEYHIDDYGQGGDLYTALLYLTDDYEGGEIIFYDGEYPEETGPVTYEPKAGQLFVFRGIDGHKVNPVISGKRALFAINLRNPPATTQITY